MIVNILFHRNCFDGIVSAALFTCFYKQCISRDVSFTYIGKQHGEYPIFDEKEFKGDVNVCVDFRYSCNPKLDWWFDHHESAFENEEARKHFEKEEWKQKFYDPTRISNGKFMADKLHEKFGFNLEPYEELLKWVDIIDGARFPDPHMTVELKEPALQLMTWIENNNNPALTEKLIHHLQKHSLEDIVKKRYIQKYLEKLLERHQEHLRVFKEKIEIRGDVAFFDLTEENVSSYNKFIVYHYHEKVLYTVGLNCFPTRCKISVGSNPWDRDKRQHNIAKICEKYGGGGHPVVGAISVDRSELERARSIAEEIIDILNNKRTLESV